MPSGARCVVAKRLDQIDRRMTRLERDVGIAVETLAVFIRYRDHDHAGLAEPARTGGAVRPGGMKRSLHRAWPTISSRGRSCGKKSPRMSCPHPMMDSGDRI